MIGFSLSLPAPPAAPSLPAAVGWGLLGSGPYLLALWEELLTEPLPLLPLCLTDLGGFYELLDRFLRRFSQTYFPLDEAWLDDLLHHGAAAEWDPTREALHPCLKAVPLRFTGRDCCDVGAEGEPYAWLQAIAAQDLAYLAAYPDLPLRPHFDLHGLAEVLGSQLPLPATLAALPLLVRVILRRTGNPWLDTCPACFEAGGETIGWADTEPLQWLAEQWQDALTHWDALADLTRWVQAAPDARLASLHFWLLEADQVRRCGQVRQLPLFPT